MVQSEPLPPASLYQLTHLSLPSSPALLPPPALPSPPPPQLLGSQEKQWTPLLRQLVAEGQLTEAAFMEALQRKMEGVVLGLQSGSYAQRVQVCAGRAGRGVCAERGVCGGLEGS